MIEMQKKLPILKWNTLLPHSWEMHLVTHIYVAHCNLSWIFSFHSSNICLLFATLLKTWGILFMTHSPKSAQKSSTRKFKISLCFFGIVREAHIIASNKRYSYRKWKLRFTETQQQSRLTEVTMQYLSPAAITITYMQECLQQSFLKLAVHTFISTWFWTSKENLI